MNRAIFWFILAACVSACGESGSNGGNPPPATDVALKCATISNVTTACAAALKASGEAVEVNAGDVVRGNSVYASISVQNARDIEFNGYIEGWFDTTCLAAAPEWHVMPFQTFDPVPAASSLTVTYGSSCDDMPLGVHHFNVILYDTDGTTVLDQATVTFNLVQ